MNIFLSELLISAQNVKATFLHLGGILMLVTFTLSQTVMQEVFCLFLLCRTHHDCLFNVMFTEQSPTYFPHDHFYGRFQCEDGLIVSHWL